MLTVDSGFSTLWLSGVGEIDTVFGSVGDVFLLTTGTGSVVVGGLGACRLGVTLTTLLATATTLES